MIDEEQWLRNLMHAYGPETIKFIRLYTRNASEAEDLLQEVFLKAFRARDSFRGDSSLRTWMWSITVRVCQDFLRRQGRKPVRLVDEGLLEALRRVPSASAETEALQLLESGELLRMVQSLPNKYQTAIVLYYFQDLDIHETAQALHITDTAVKSRLFRGRNELKKMLQAEGGRNPWTTRL